MTLKRLQIIEHLEREPRLTAQQLATLFATSYSGMTRILNRMAYPKCPHNQLKDGSYKQEFCKHDSQIKVKKIHQNAPLFFHLPDVKAPSLHSFQHEKECADIYVAYYELIQAWYWQAHEEYLRIGLKPDRSSIIDGKLIFWEIDRGTEVLAIIRDKVEKYIKLSTMHPDQRFHVIFTASRGRAKSILLDVLLDIRSKVWFYVGDHSRVIATPLEPVFASPIRPATPVSIGELDGKPM